MIIKILESGIKDLFGKKYINNSILFNRLWRTALNKIVMLRETTLDKSKYIIKGSYLPMTAY